MSYNPNEKEKFSRKTVATADDRIKRWVDEWIKARCYDLSPCEADEDATSRCIVRVIPRDGCSVLADDGKLPHKLSLDYNLFKMIGSPLLIWKSQKLKQYVYVRSVLFFSLWNSSPSFSNFHYFSQSIIYLSLHKVSEIHTCDPTIISLYSPVLTVVV